MRDTIIAVLRSYFHFNDIVLGRIADDIIISLQENNYTTLHNKRSCFNCIHFHTLITTYVGENPNLCQKGHKKTLIAAKTCPDYIEGTIVNNDTSRTYTNFNTK